MIAINRILCPVDFSDSSRHALAHAAAAASWYEAPLTVLHVFSNVPVFDVAPALGVTAMPPVAVRELDREAMLTALRNFAAPVVGTATTEVQLTEAPDPRTEILEQASAMGAGLLVMGTHGRSGFDHLLLGSVTEKVVRKAPCPVLVVPRQAAEAPVTGAPPFKRILCAVDFSPTSLHALSYALDLAQEADARISLLHVIEIPPELGEFPLAKDVNINGIRAASEAEYLQRLRALIPPEARTYCTVATQVSEGRAHREILRAAAEEKADLVVMGVHGRGAVELLLFGSNTNAVLRSAACPVLVVPSA
jgi:nucleotide-binding universal stress UspA family protein